MFDIFSFIKINLVLIFALFIPGWVFLHYFFQKHSFSWLEKIIISLGLSLFFINFFFIFTDKLNFSFSSSSFIFIGIVLPFFFLTFFSKNKKVTIEEKFTQPNKIFWLLIFSAVLLRVFYLSDKTTPSSTDLGHHMYWAKSIITSNQLPNYGMPDFIIGEHIIFAFISFLSNWDLISALPMTILFLFNIFSLLIFYLLAKKIANFLEIKNSFQIANLTLLTGGVFYAFSSPQTSFVSGGVIGNILGNFFIPLSLFLFLLTLEKKSTWIGLIAIFSTMNLIYTHHLSSYVLLFILLFFFTFLILNDFFQIFIKEKKFLFFSKSFWKTFFSPLIVSALLFFIAFIFFVQPPSYLNKSAINIAIGNPSKATRTGYSWQEMNQILGDWRFFNGVIGFICLLTILFFSKKFFPKTLKTTTKKIVLKKIHLYSILLILAWGTALFLMSWKPQWLKTDIPSRRIISYLTWPVSLLSAFGLFFFFQLIKNNLPKKSTQWFLIIILSAGFFSSNIESKPYLLSNENNSEAYQTFSASQYLTENTTSQEQILKDHIYLKGDTWVKLFLMRGYNQPLSRTNLSRYDDPSKPRETCTRDIIANPDNTRGKECLKETNIQYVFLKKNRDEQNFKKSQNWSKVFSNQQTVIFSLNHNE